MARRFLPLFQKIAKNAVNGTKPVTIQTGIVDGENIQLDQQLPVTAKLPNRFTSGIKVKVEGELNGVKVEGELTLVHELGTGETVKVIKEDGTSKYYVLDTL